MDVLKLCGMGVLCALVAMIMKQIKGEYSALVRVCGTVIIFGALVLVASDIFSDITAGLPVTCGSQFSQAVCFSVHSL